MEMCYNGSLVMPNNYAVVSNDEMEYIDGGANGWWNAVWFITGAIDTVLYLVPAIAAANKASKLGKGLGAALKAVGVAKSTMISGTIKLLKKIGLNVSKAVVSNIVGAVWTFAGFSIGGLIATGIDRIDGRYNGYCFG